MKKFNLATALALSLAVPFCAQALADEDVTIRVMEMHENTSQAVMKQIQLPDLAQDKVTDEGTYRYRNRKLTGQSTTPGDGEGNGEGTANGYQGDGPSEGEGVGEMDRDRIQDQDRIREMEQDQDRIRDTDQVIDHEPAQQEQHIGEPENGPSDSNQQGPGTQG